MNSFTITLKGWLSKAKVDLLWGIKHPSTVRKATVAALTHVVAVLAAFEYFLPAVSTGHAAIFTGVTAALTWLATFLTNNKVIEVTQDIEGK